MKNITSYKEQPKESQGNYADIIHSRLQIRNKTKTNRKKPLKRQIYIYFLNGEFYVT